MQAFGVLSFACCLFLHVLYLPAMEYRGRSAFCIQSDLLYDIAYYFVD